MTINARAIETVSTRPDWPSFSIVIPTYQRRDVVCAAVRALSEIDYPGDRELIVVVDGSMDGTADRLREIDCPFAFRIIEQANSGPARARNRGAAEARNEILLFLDDDMIAEPGLIAEHARFYGGGADAVIGETPIDPKSAPGFLTDSVGRWIASEQVQTPLCPFDIFSGQLSVRRSAFEALGGFDPALTTDPAFGNEDADFGVRLLAAYDVRHNPAAVSYQRYSVSPRDYMKRAKRAVAADVQFAQKHPELSRQLFERRGFRRPVIRWIILPLTRLPLVSDLTATFAVQTAELALKTPFKRNRLIARFFSGARTLAYWSALRASGWLPFSESLLVLCYHAIEDQSDDPVLAPFGVPPAQFKNQLNSLTRRGYIFITPAQLAAFMDSGAPLPRRPALLTFDDGYVNLVDMARNVLRPRGIEALAFAVSAYVSKTNEWDQQWGARPARLLSAEGLREVAALGLEIGSHSRTHSELPLLSTKDQATEARQSSDELVAMGLRRPRFFAYPYGARDGSSKQAVADAGYLAAFGLRQRWMRRTSDRFDLPRAIILSTDRGWLFWIKTAAPRAVGWYRYGRRALGLRP